LGSSAVVLAILFNHLRRVLASTSCTEIQAPRSGIEQECLVFRHTSKGVGKLEPVSERRRVKADTEA
jgi:hypothetical protein